VTVPPPIERPRAHGIIDLYSRHVQPSQLFQNRAGYPGKPLGKILSRLQAKRIKRSSAKFGFTELKFGFANQRYPFSPTATLLSRKSK